MMVPLGIWVFLHCSMLVWIFSIILVASALTHDPSKNYASTERKKKVGLCKDTSCSVNSILQSKSPACWNVKCLMKLTVSACAVHYFPHLPCISLSLNQLSCSANSQPSDISLHGEVAHVSWTHAVLIHFFKKCIKNTLKTLWFVSVWVFHHCKNFCLQYCPAWWLTCAHRGNNSNEEVQGCR